MLEAKLTRLYAPLDISVLSPWALRRSVPLESQGVEGSSSLHADQWNAAEEDASLFQWLAFENCLPALGGVGAVSMETRMA